MNAKEMRQYADLIDQRRQIDHAIAVQNGTLPTLSERIDNQAKRTGLMVLVWYLIGGIFGR
jgi:hypothetical protein